MFGPVSKRHVDSQNNMARNKWRIVNMRLRVHVSRPTCNEQTRMDDTKCWSVHSFGNNQHRKVHSGSCSDKVADERKPAKSCPSWHHTQALLKTKKAAWLEAARPWYMYKILPSETAAVRKRSRMCQKNNKNKMVFWAHMTRRCDAVRTVRVPERLSPG